MKLRDFIDTLNEAVEECDEERAWEKMKELIESEMVRPSLYEME